MNDSKLINVSKLIENSKYNKFFLAVFVMGLIALLFDGYDQTVYGTALPAQIADTGFPPTVFGLIGTSTMYGMMIGSIIFGTLADKIGRKTMLIVGIIGYTICTGLYGLANSAAVFGVLRTLSGAFLIGIVPVVFAMIIEYSPVTHRARLGIYSTIGVPIGTVLCSLMGIFLVPAFGWRTMYLLAFIPIFMAVIVYLFYPESMERLVKTGKKDTIRGILVKADPEFVPSENDEYVTEGTKQKNKATFSALFKQGMARNTILYFIIYSSAFYSVYGLVTWLPKLMMSAGGYEMTSSLQFFFCYVLGSIPGILIGSRIVYKLGYKKSICTFTVIGAVFSLILSTKPNVILTCILLFLIGAAIYGYLGMLFSYQSTNYPNAVRSTAIGWINGVGRLGGSLGPTVGGYLVATNASFSFSFIAFAFIPLVISSAAILLTKDYTEFANLNKPSAAKTPETQS